MHIIPIDAIRNLKPCADQLSLVEAEWPGGVPVNAKTIRRARELGLDLDWFSREFLRTPARAEYERVIAPARAEYERVRAPARAEYERATSTAWAVYERVRAPARAEYERVIAPARAEYERVRDQARAEH